jgi:hypothetical protein
MSDTAELQFIYAPQTHIINTSFQKQQPASKLVNRYLSTAAQYLNRTKSFHVPSTNNLGQSMQNINPVKSTSHTLPMSIMDTSTNNSSTLPLNCNDNKTQGLVNTLRRSLRKNKDRFYNKRSATMKSCHSLNTYEQITNQDIHSKISMTPTLFARRQHLNDSHSNNKSDQIRKNKRQVSVVI